ncbi:MAG TPA: hypothetical protein VEQ58_02465 [Polyangiaceae bacterium]|nr:hypothetical protein [Polyangiaceae bacterium]
MSGEVEGHELQLATERAVGFLLSQRFEERSCSDGRRVGIQSAMALSPSGEGALELYDLADGRVVETIRPPGEAAPSEPLRDRWQRIAGQVQEQLGFPLEPELFSNMLFVAYAGTLDHPYVQRVAEALLGTFRHSDARGLYHFFTSLRFACDIDCTGVAARARLILGDLELTTSRGARELSQINSRILRSAAVRDVPSEHNRTHGKENGALTRHVFKVYLDDHEVQGAEYDRGLKNNPAVVANALFPVLFELASGRRDPSELIALKEFCDGEAGPRTAEASVASIVVANLRYLRQHLLSGAWRQGCRYYGSPDAFLCFYSELLYHFGPMTPILGSPALLANAVRERRSMRADGMENPHGSLNLALRAVAAGNLGIDRSAELRALLDSQGPAGAWEDFGALYSFGSSHAPRVYFGSKALTVAFALRAFMPLDAAPPALADDLDWLALVRRMAADVGSAHSSALAASEQGQ